MRVKEINLTFFLGEFGLGIKYEAYRIQNVSNIFNINLFQAYAKLVHIHITRTFELFLKR